MCMARAVKRAGRLRGGGVGSKQYVRNICNTDSWEQMIVAGSGRKRAVNKS